MLNSGCWLTDQSWGVCFCFKDSTAKIVCLWFKWFPPSRAGLWGQTSQGQLENDRDCEHPWLFPAQAKTLSHCYTLLHRLSDWYIKSWVLQTIFLKKDLQTSSPTCFFVQQGSTELDKLTWYAAQRGKKMQTGIPIAVKQAICLNGISTFPHCDSKIHLFTLLKILLWVPQKNQCNFLHSFWESFFSWRNSARKKKKRFLYGGSIRLSTSTSFFEICDWSFL